MMKEGSKYETIIDPLQELTGILICGSKRQMGGKSTSTGRKKQRRGKTTASASVRCVSQFAQPSASQSNVIPQAPHPSVEKVAPIGTHASQSSNLQAGPANRTRQRMLGLSKRSRAASDLMADAGSIKDPNSRGKVVIDITGKPAGPPKIPGCGQLCAWGSPHAGGIKFRVAPPSFDIPKASDKIPPEGQPKANADKGKKKIWQP
ncbi:hypothetical protein FH972_011052 [Carpinus fangiana]|uniref:Uncharacterized protein n=1 Tax=Carpinus fangiana TaxID=176857 RepID=A0A660KQ30_9ROSI|nr:hypothetical protein FH972_011052 [Carpinus fangiana]